LDMLIIVAYAIIMMWILNAIGLVANMESWFIYTIMGLPIFFYSLFFEVLMNGQTPGKFVNNIRVVKIDGSKPTFGSYL
ncbi:RDD family protein, partial [Vibrio sp. 404]|nr:RDD family protein [Vibrio marinisediminis]